MAKFSIFFMSLCFVPYLFALDPYSYYTRIDLPSGVVAPDSVALDRNNEGPYACVNDGRILKYKGPTVGWTDFAYTSPNRTKELCDGVRDTSLGQICGRCLGFSFNSLTGDLYIVDAFYGVFVVGPKGGLATLLVNSAEGVPFRFLTGIDADSVTGDLYFTEASTIFDLRNATQPNYLVDSTGRLLKYNLWTKEVKVLLKGLARPLGPAISIDRTFVLFSELGKKRVLKYRVLGVIANRTEVVLDVPGTPRKIKRATALGQFWVAVSLGDDAQFGIPYAYRINRFGNVLLKKDLQDQYNNNLTISLVQEYNVNGASTLLIGSRNLAVNFIGIYSTNKI